MIKHNNIYTNYLISTKNSVKNYLLITSKCNYKEISERNEFHVK
jgi:hypothetical protein